MAIVSALAGDAGLPDAPPESASPPVAAARCPRWLEAPAEVCAALSARPRADRPSVMEGDRLVLRRAFKASAGGLALDFVMLPVFVGGATGGVGTAEIAVGMAAPAGALGGGGVALSSAALARAERTLQRQGVTVDPGLRIAGTVIGGTGAGLEASAGLWWGLGLLLDGEAAQVGPISLAASGLALHLTGGLLLSVAHGRTVAAARALDGTVPSDVGEVPEHTPHPVVWAPTVDVTRGMVGATFVW